MCLHFRLLRLPPGRKWLQLPLSVRTVLHHQVHRRSEQWTCVCSLSLVWRDSEEQVLVRSCCLTLCSQSKDSSAHSVIGRTVLGSSNASRRCECLWINVADDVDIGTVRGSLDGHCQSCLCWSFQLRTCHSANSVPTETKWAVEAVSRPFSCEWKKRFSLAAASATFGLQVSAVANRQSLRGHLCSLHLLHHCC